MARDGGAQHSIRSVPQFLREILALAKRWDIEDLWFRGHPDVDFLLTPKIYRRSYDEYELKVDFQRRAPQYINESRPSDDWERYFLMQHFGVPTRLLDWTDAALLALYFAVREDTSQQNESKDSAVWVIDPYWVNRHSLGRDSIVLPEFPEVQPWLPKGEGTVRRKYPIAIDPPHLARRMEVQHSHFLLFGRDKKGLESLAQQDGNRAKLARLVIAGGRRRDRIRSELSACGIKETSVFPDLEGLGRELEQQWRDD